MTNNIILFNDTWENDFEILGIPTYFTFFQFVRYENNYYFQYLYIIYY